MGSLTQWVLPREFVRAFPVFVETGTGAGDSLAYAAEHDFRTLFSGEIHRPLWEKALARFENDHRVFCFCGTSESIVRMTSVTQLPEFFWLDAHFPGSDHADLPWDRRD